MIDYEHEQLIPIKQVCKMFPGRAGNGISLASVWRWVLHGRRGHKLETIIVGGERYTSREAVRRFLAALNDDAAYSQDHASELAERQLEGEGF